MLTTHSLLTYKTQEDAFAYALNKINDQPNGEYWCIKVAYMAIKELRCHGYNYRDYHSHGSLVLLTEFTTKEDEIFIYRLNRNLSEINNIHRQEDPFVIDKMIFLTMKALQAYATDKGNVCQIIRNVFVLLYKINIYHENIRSKLYLQVMLFLTAAIMETTLSNDYAIAELLDYNDFTQTAVFLDQLEEDGDNIIVQSTHKQITLNIPADDEMKKLIPRAKNKMHLTKKFNKRHNRWIIDLILKRLYSNPKIPKFVK